MSKKLPPVRNFAPLQYRYIAAAKPSEPDGRTQGQYLNECDINVVVATYRRADEPYPNQRAAGRPQYADLPDATDLHSSLNMVADATNAFNSLPSDVRERYGNNPVDFVSALAVPSERAFLLDSGVMELHEMPKLPSDRLKEMAAPAASKSPEKGDAG